MPTREEMKIKYDAVLIELQEFQNWDVMMICDEEM